jgi:hypothetical protein
MRRLAGQDLALIDLRWRGEEFRGVRKERAGNFPLQMSVSTFLVGERVKNGEPPRPESDREPTERACFPEHHGPSGFEEFRAWPAKSPKLRTDPCKFPPATFETRDTKKLQKRSKSDAPDF